jgi:FixJ family two-component response regulator
MHEIYPIQQSLASAVSSRRAGVCLSEEFIGQHGEVSCDCVITDVQMPRMSGFDLKQRSLLGTPESLSS